MTADTGGEKPPIKIKPSTGLSVPHQDLARRLSEAELLRMRQDALGDEGYTPDSAGERLKSLGLEESMWGEVQNRLSHELRALIRIAKGGAPRLLRDVLPEVNAEEKFGKGRLKYLQQPILEDSRFDGWEKYVGAKFETMTRGVFFEDGVFLWTSDAGHSAMMLASNREEEKPAIDVTVMSRHPSAEEASIHFRVFPDVPDTQIDLLAGYFRKSMNDSEQVKFSISYPVTDHQRHFFTGTFSGYFKARQK